jgi:hypothetical protein
MTNSEVLAKYILTDTRVIITYSHGELHDKTNPMNPNTALVLVETLERLGATVAVYRAQS